MIAMVTATVNGSVNVNGTGSEIAIKIVTGIATKMKSEGIAVAVIEMMMRWITIPRTGTGTGSATRSANDIGVTGMTMKSGSRIRSIIITTTTTDLTEALNQCLEFRHMTTTFSTIFSFCF